MPTLEEALRAGGVHGGLEGLDKPAVLREMVGRLPLPPVVNKDWFLQMLLARESLASTGIGDGIAIPHVRHPILMRIPRPMVTLCFLRHPVDFDAVDGQPVQALFTLISPTVKSHLHLLARLGFAVGHEPFREALRRHAPAADIFSAAAAIDLRCREAAGAPTA
jgi:PTS system nitrogen regulatory IIA component